MELLTVWSLIVMVMSIHSVCCDEMDQSPSQVKRPGDLFKLSCKISGFDMTSYYMSWIRQKPGKALEWIGSIDSGSTDAPDYSDSLQGQFILTEDVSTSTQFLEANSLRSEDSAVYYCARCDAFDYWGKGTQVTVSTATTATPTLFPLMNCGTPTNDIYSIGCLATGFSPSSITFNWTDASGSPLTDFVQYPSVQSGGAYIGVSQVRVAKNDWENSTSFICSVEHPGGGKTAVINKPVPKSPTVSLLSAPIGTTQYLMCMIEDFTSETVKVTWKKNDMEVEVQTPTLGKKPSGLYSGSSLLKVINSDWNNKVKYSCVVEHQDQTISKTTSKTEPLTVTLNPPRVREVFLDNQAVLECVITATDQDTVSGTNITWQVNGRDKMNGIDLKPIESKGNLNSRVSTLTIDQKDWTKVNKVQCSAKKSGEDTPVIQELSFTKGSEAPSVSVHLLPEENTREEVTVTLVCLVVCPSLCDVYIMWQVNSNQYQEGVTSPPQKTQKGNYFVTSVFTTTKDMWKTNVLFTCAVKDLGSDNNTTPQGRNVSKSMANILLTEPEAGFALSCTDNDEDEFSSLWSTTSSFIILFLLSLTYSTVLSLVKMKQ
ncbi:immunoglobulin gamma-1 heavy chain-like [Salvelinus fontinalis]|uniref:immunoglobulin gamma-1 heavy chain-like n=1 Tax=Salvelinus fontinalis TaxID=8038 RepID=UPI0024868D86|nr:immunoglobulin gamma-1 heavy chain-like [Salvelinus fontinalis]